MVILDVLVADHLVRALMLRDVHLLLGLHGVVVHAVHSAFLGYRSAWYSATPPAHKVGDKMFGPKTTFFQDLKTSLAEIAAYQTGPHAARNVELASGVQFARIPV